MKRSVPLTITSLLSIVLMSVHHADDVVRGMAPAGFANLVPILFLFAWLYATLALSGRRAGYLILLVWSLLASCLPVIHMKEAGFAGGDVADRGRAFFFAWTLLALGVAALGSAALAARELLTGRQGEAR